MQCIGFLPQFVRRVGKERHTQQHHKYLLVTLTDGIADLCCVLFLLLVARRDGCHKVEIFYVASVCAVLFGVNLHLRCLDFPHCILGFYRCNINAENDVRHLLEQRRHKIIAQLLRVLRNRHRLGKSVVNFRVFGCKAHRIGRNRIAEVVA